MPLSIPRTYAELLRRVQATLFTGQREIEIAWVRTYHETGRLIHCHVLAQDRADYGARVIKRLAQDTGASVRRLYECAQFYRCFPIVRPVAQLGWNRGRLLSQVTDVEQRETLVAQALKHDWASTEIQARVRALNAATVRRSEASASDAGSSPLELLEPRRGTPGLHPIVDRGDGPVVDLGFRLYRALGSTSKLATGDIVRLGDDGVRRMAGATKTDLFTYKATIRRVIDGDTLAVALQVAPGITLELKLRLRGVDCPELSTDAGRAAQRFVNGLVTAGDEVMLSTTKPDKYDRYLADVFVGARDERIAQSASQKDGSAPRLSSPGSQPVRDIFLNNALLEGGHAVRYDGVGLKEE